MYMTNIGVELHTISPIHTTARINRKKEEGENITEGPVIKPGIDYWEGNKNFFHVIQPEYLQKFETVSNDKKYFGKVSHQAEVAI